MKREILFKYCFDHLSQIEKISILFIKFQNPSCLIKTQVSYRSVPLRIIQLPSFTNLAHAWCISKKILTFGNFFHFANISTSRAWPGNTKGGSIHFTVDLLFDRVRLVCFANKNKNCQLSYSWFQTSQTGGQQYSDTSPFSIPWPGLILHFSTVINIIITHADWLNEERLEHACTVNDQMRNA
jgi:hypothetical protein